MALKERKTALRKQITAELKKLDPGEIERQSATITRMILQLPAYQKAKSLAVFLSMPGREASTRDIVLHSLDNGKSVFVPYLHPGELPGSRIMDMLELHNKEDFESLKSDAWGIPSLAEDSVGNRRNALGGMGISNTVPDQQDSFPPLDIIFMPAVAFDESHYRLGHGKGFYDRYLARYESALDSTQGEQAMPLLVGISLRQQVLPPGESVPADEHDWTVDQVVVAEMA
ncbi:hypothetical protein H2200_003063 [Cladophialophora chaetospira]|uniref:5-formyltetrahydrofolate cyclo-ligase n=1 Tax=Cladophialophora chaetospira TaxID=386627 RepID=A0AA38XGS9_9EURO|nr:hypothetical protein H2200_003063 [Cladophialophora chaetospira]